MNVRAFMKKDIQGKDSTNLSIVRLFNIKESCSQTFTILWSSLIETEDDIVTL